MSYHPAVQQVSESAAAIGGHQFRNLRDIEAMVSSTPSMLANFATAYRVMGEQLAQTPAGVEIGAAYLNLAAQFQAMSQGAETSAAMFQAAHTTDLNRLNNPRPNEHMADYGTNLG